MKGVYFLANDHVYNLAVAFLNSFRMHNPNINLCLIPYDNNHSHVSQLSSTYNFTVFGEKEKLSRCDEISHMFHGNVTGAYRKLCAWEGPYSQFIYIDIDTVVLDNVEFAFEYLGELDILTSHSNIDGIRKFVWKDGIESNKILDNRQISYAASTGFICSRRDHLSVDKAWSRVADGLKLKRHMELDCMEQPFLNYLIVTESDRYSSLRVIQERTRRNDIPQEIWAGIQGGVVNDGSFAFPGNIKCFLMHWAGIWQRAGTSGNLPYSNLWTYYYNEGKPLEPLNETMEKDGLIG